MTFFNILRRKNSAKVNCKCGAKYRVSHSSVFTSETVDKGKLCFYTYCKVCERIIFIEESKLSKRFVKNKYKDHKWSK